MFSLQESNRVKLDLERALFLGRPVWNADRHGNSRLAERSSLIDTLTVFCPGLKGLRNVAAFYELVSRAAKLLRQQ